MADGSIVKDHFLAVGDQPAIAERFPRILKNERLLLFVLLALATCTWLPRLKGPIDLRWDGGVYYILGTSLAEGKGYKLLNEPGEIDAVQYPPLLPAIVATHQLVLGTSDPIIVGRWLRLTAFLTFIVYIFAVFRLLRLYLSPFYAFLASLLCLFSVHVYFLSDLCFPEILFGLATILFFLFKRNEMAGAYFPVSYIFALAAYALRTVGLALFAAWVLESLIKRNFKQALIRLVLCLVPVLCWQFYIASVEGSYQYNHPSYSYQREPYMFYNVTYARNIALDDPFAPEKGKAQLIRRVVGNGIRIPFYLGETVTTVNYYWEEELLQRFELSTTTRAMLAWLDVCVLYVIGLCVIAGLLLMLFGSDVIIPLFVLIYIATLCLTPFPQQYTRYLMPITPFLVLSVVAFMLRIGDTGGKRLHEKWGGLSEYLVIGSILIALLFQCITFKYIYFNLFEPVEYYGRNGEEIRTRMFFETDSFQAFNLCINYVSQHASPDDVVAAGTPHWIYLRTGLKSVMPPFEMEPSHEMDGLDSVPVKYLIAGKDVIGSERYTLPMLEQFPEKWEPVYTVPDSNFSVYRRTDR